MDGTLAVRVSGINSYFDYVMTQFTAIKQTDKNFLILLYFGCFDTQHFRDT